MGELSRGYLCGMDHDLPAEPAFTPCVHTLEPNDRTNVSGARSHMYMRHAFTQGIP